MRAHATRALEAPRHLLANPPTPPAVGLGTALAISQRPHFPQPGWHLPERIESEREQQVVDTLKEIKSDYDEMRMTEALQAKANQKKEEESSPSAQIARNAPCPCGSGAKYKRCCGSASPGKFTPSAKPQRAAA